MAEFTYIARDNAGQKVSGTLSAVGRREALTTLAGRSLFPIEVRSDSPVVGPKRVRRVPAQLLATTYGQLADLLRSGVPLLRAIEVMQKQTSHSGLKYVLGEVHHQVEDGSTLAQAMGRFERIFGEMAVSMIRAGGEGGFLEEALTRVAQFTETQDELKKRTIGAVVYPVFLAVVGVTVVTVLIVFFVPQFAELFDRLRKEGKLPAITEGLLWLSGWLGGWWGLFLLVGLIAGAWFARRWLGSAAGRMWWDHAKLRIPLLGVIFLHLAVARFCRVLGTLLKNGVPILRSLQISSDATGNRVLAAAIQSASENISEGQPLAGPLGQSGKFPVTVVEMIAVAEQANTLETVLLDVADGLERRTWRRLDLVVRMLEPVLLLIIAAIVLVVVIALLLPVLRSAGALG